jgi:hypothetical protein
MHDQYTYLIQLRGPVDVDELNALTPLRMTRVRADTTTTLVTMSTDQAGLIGLMRHLHGLGFQFLSVTCHSHHQENEDVKIKTDSSR